MGNKLSAVRRLTPWHSFCFFFCFYLFFFFVQSSVSFFVFFSQIRSDLHQLERISLQLETCRSFHCSNYHLFDQVLLKRPRKLHSFSIFFFLKLYSMMSAFGKKIKNGKKNVEKIFRKKRNAERVSG